MDFPDYSKYFTDPKFSSGIESPFEPGTSGLPDYSKYYTDPKFSDIDWNQTPSVEGGGSRWGEALKKATDYLDSSNRTSASRRKQVAQPTSGVQPLGNSEYFAIYPAGQTAPQQSGLSKALGFGGAALGAIAPFTGPAAPFLAAGSTIAGAGSRIT
jgi:hypothetical protein